MANLYAVLRLSLEPDGRAQVTLWCAGNGVVQNLATTIQQLLLLLLKEASAPPSHGASQTAPGAMPSTTVPATNGSDDSMSIVTPLQGNALQVGCHIWCCSGCILNSMCPAHPHLSM